MGMKVKDIDALREQISKDPREAFTKHQVWLFASEHNKTVPTVEAIPKADYETRLKAGMVAMLEEIRLEADELQGHKYNSDFWEGVYTYDDIVKEKINLLKGDTK